MSPSELGRASLSPNQCRMEDRKMNGFKDVVGHQELIEYIQSAVRQKKVSHAYILNGERGSGKKMVAGLFAMTLQCEQGGVEPCGTCKSCRQAQSGNQPDIITVTHEKPGSISVEDIRTQVNGDIQIKPYSSPYKIYVIPEADLLTVQAQNALLKTIEEPPEYARIFLLTENADSLLATIRSRCVTLKFRNIPDARIKEYLMQRMRLPDYQAEICTAFAQGNLGKAILLATSESFHERKEAVIQLLTEIDRMQLPDLVGVIKEWNQHKQDITEYLDMITIWYRDVLLYKATEREEGMVFRGNLEEIREKAHTISYEGIEATLQAVEQARARLKANVNFDLVIELLLLTMKEN